MAVNTNAPYTIMGRTFTLPSALDLSTIQYCCVKVDSTGRVTPTVAVTDVALGILTNDPNAADLEAVIANGGIYPTKFAAACGEGTRVTPEAAATARVQARTATTDYVVGVSIGEAFGANEIVPVMWGPQGIG